MRKSKYSKSIEFSGTPSRWKRDYRCALSVWFAFPHQQRAMTMSGQVPRYPFFFFHSCFNLSLDLRWTITFFWRKLISKEMGTSVQRLQQWRPLWKFVCGWEKAVGCSAVQTVSRVFSFWNLQVWEKGLKILKYLFHQ